MQKACPNIYQDKKISIYSNKFRESKSLKKNFNSEELVINSLRDFLAYILGYHYCQCSTVELPSVSVVQ